MITIENLSLRIDNSVIFKGLTAQLSAKRIWLKAPNGKGKSSLLALLAGVYQPWQGQVHYHGQALRQPQLQVAWVAESWQLPDFISGAQLLDFWYSQWQSADLSASRLQTIPERATALANDFGFTPYWSTPIGVLSSGNLQKLKLILAFCRPSQILLLDEAHTALDVQGEQVFWQQVASYAGQIILVGHDLHPAQLTDFQVWQW